MKQLCTTLLRRRSYGSCRSSSIHHRDGFMHLIYTIEWLCSSCPNQYPVKGKSKHWNACASSKYSAPSCWPELSCSLPGKWMDRLSYHRCHSGTLHGFSHSTRRSQAIIKVFSSFLFTGAWPNFTQYYLRRKIQTDLHMFDIKIYLLSWIITTRNL